MMKEVLWPSTKAPPSCSPTLAKAGPPKANMPPPCFPGLAASSSSLLTPVWQDGEGPRVPAEASPQQALADKYRGEEFSESSDNTKEYRKEYEALLRKEKTGPAEK